LSGSEKNIRRYLDETLPEEYEKCLVGLNAVTREAWNTAQSTEDKREKILALSLAKECYSMKLDLLTNATVVDDAMKYVQQSKEKVVNNTSLKEEEEEIQTTQQQQQEEEAEELE
jgi:hypothetical protein